MVDNRFTPTMYCAFMFGCSIIQGIGLTLEEALTFWRSEFTKIMEVDKVIDVYRRFECLHIIL